MTTPTSLADAARELGEALKDATAIIRKFVPSDALGINSEGGGDGWNDRSWPILDEHLHYMDEAVAKAEAALTAHAATVQSARETARAIIIKAFGHSNISYYGALWNGIAEALASRDESLHYANGVAELAMKHRDDAEAKVASRDAKIAELEARTAFICGPRDAHQLGKDGAHYIWAINELTERKAYSKDEIAIIIAEQRERAEHYEKKFQALLAKRGK